MGLARLYVCYCCVFFFSSRRRHTRCALVTGVQTCALPISSFRMVGAEFASFYPRKAYEAGIATPIQIVLPREADVELRRNGVLISVRHYGAGAQEIGRASCRESVCQYV